MRKVLPIITAFALIASGALAATGANHKPPRKHDWWCSATGLDYQQHNRSVSGPNRPTEPEARSAALNACYNQGLMACTVNLCMDESRP
jgi:hypothetical protein